MNKIKLILIGCGPHAKRIYLPAVEKLRERMDVELLLVVDLYVTRDSVASAINQTTFKPQMWFIAPFPSELPAQLEEHLSQFVKENNINGVIIATEPLVHKAYADWALRNKLNILIDKPITARVDSASKLSSADGILDDYISLLELYKNIQQTQETVFVINSQRRFHAGFCFVEKLLKEIGDKTNCPVTFIQSYHSDGQWRFPSEIVTQDYHPYCSGYGKASHSGYHFFDMLYRLYIASGVKTKFADSMEIVSSFVQPNGFIRQLSETDYHALFNDRYDSVKKWSDKQLQETYKCYGEIDLSAIVTLKRDEDIIANLSVNLIHNGFARRTWLEPGEDLYKGNGRVKHEHHNIQQGPFQNIQIHSYQSKDKHGLMENCEDDLGGNNHFDVYVFRNPLVTDSENSLKIYKFSEILSEMEKPAQTMLLMESAKYQVVEEFLEYISGYRKKSELSSLIEDHIVPVQIMRGIYRSHIQRNNKLDCVVRSSFGFS